MRRSILRHFMQLQSIAAMAIVLLFASVISKADGWSSYYSTQPDVQNCTPGVLTNETKASVLTYVNYIRSLHGLKLVTYKPSEDEMSQECATIMVANNDIEHVPPSTWYCLTNGGKDAAAKSNLFISWFSSASQVPTCEEGIQNWMIDSYTATLGHRLAIINPFLSEFAFGRADGSPKVSSQYTYATSMSFKWGDNTNQDLSDWSMDYVAVPYHDYPIELFDKSWVLSFSVFFDKANWGNNVNVDYSAATVTVEKEDGTAMSVSGLHVDDDQYWGGVGNCFSWKVANLENNVRYNVTIKNVKYSGTMHEYSYWFNLNNKSMAAPETPTLNYPADAATEIETNPRLIWNPAQRAYTYHLQMKKDGSDALYLEDSVITNYSYSLTKLTPLSTYSWRVRAKNEGGLSDWSPWWNFTVGNVAPSIPVLSSPANASTNISLTPTLSWNSANYAINYKLMIGTTKDYLDDEIILSETGIPDTFFVVPSGKLIANKQYFWKVRSVNAIGESNSWSTSFRFKTAENSGVDDYSNITDNSISVYPNPCNGKTTINYYVANQGNVSVELFDALGKRVISLVNNAMQIGEYSAELDCSALTAGVYYLRLVSNGDTKTSMIQVVK